MESGSLRQNPFHLLHRCELDVEIGPLRRSTEEKSLAETAAGEDGPHAGGERQPSAESGWLAQRSHPVTVPPW